MIYVHVPFCRSFCTYCDFYSELTHSCRTGAERPFAQWTEDVCAEIAARRAEIADTLAVNTLYFGGGTPSVLPKECLSRIVDTLGYGPYDEFTVEVNPEDLVEKGPGYVRSLLEFGVNRISMGVQSLDDGILRWMNRRHDAARAREAFRMLPAGISRSVDLITGVPGMTDEMLQHTVDEVVSWCPEHVSAYQLSIEEGSALAGMIADGRVKEASEEQCRRQYELLCRTLSAAGYHHYEISNWPATRRCTTRLTGPAGPMSAWAPGLTASASSRTAVRSAAGTPGAPRRGRWRAAKSSPPKRSAKRKSCSFPAPTGDRSPKGTGSSPTTLFPE